MNLRSIYNELPEPMRTAMLDRIHFHWPSNARTGQIIQGTETFHVLVGGRGSGKTRAGAEWIREKAKQPDQRLLLVARTAADVREVLVEGESGILNVTPVFERPMWNPSMRRLTWANGTTAFCVSSDEPDSIRGHQVHATWIDEPHGRPHPRGGVNAFDAACLSTRLGPTPQVLLTGTSQSQSDPLWMELKDLFDHRSFNFRGSDVIFYLNKTLENKSHLPPSYVRHVLDIYAGTAAEGRELDGQL